MIVFYYFLFLLWFFLRLLLQPLGLGDRWAQVAAAFWSALRIKIQLFLVRLNAFFFVFWKMFHFEVFAFLEPSSDCIAAPQTQTRARTRSCCHGLIAWRKTSLRAAGRAQRGNGEEGSSQQKNFVVDWRFGPAWLGPQWSTAIAPRMQILLLGGAAESMTCVAFSSV